MHEVSTQECRHSSATEVPASVPPAEMPKALMLAFAFPPTAVAGTVRTLKFVRYLPDYGWKQLSLNLYFTYQLNMIVQVDSGTHSSRD